MMDINYELYKVFFHVANSLSFSKASKQLFISQSAVSQSIKVLEKKLNHPLFTRNTKQVHLTPEGEILLKHIEPAMNLIRQGESRLLEAHSLEGGQLRIGTSESACRYFLLPYLKKFHQRHPKIHVKIISQPSLDYAKLLDLGEIDLYIGNYPGAGLPGQQNIQVIREFFDVFVASEEYSQLKGRKVGLEELLSYPILTTGRKSASSDSLHNLFCRHQLDFVPEIELSDSGLLVDLARAGLGIAFVPEYCMPEDAKNLFLLDLAEQTPVRKLVAVCRHQPPIPPAAKAFREML